MAAGVIRKGNLIGLIEAMMQFRIAETLTDGLGDEVMKVFRVE